MTQTSKAIPAGEGEVFDPAIYDYRKVPAYKPATGYSVNDAAASLGVRCLTRQERKAGGELRSHVTLAIFCDGLDYFCVPVA